MLADTTVRLATPGDATRIAVLSRDLIEHGLPWRWRPERIRRAIADPDTNVVVAGPADAASAFGIMAHGEDDAHLLLFAVAREQQRRGLGSALLAWLEQVARNAGAQRIVVEARRDNTPARCFYNEHGYHERALAKAMYGDVVDGVRLEKWLRSVTPGPGGRGRTARGG